MRSKRRSRRCPRRAAAAPGGRRHGGSRHQPEVFYQIFVRSFRDSNGDRIGDLRGITARLDYLKSLKVTSILLTPLQASPFYHNYFATDFRRIDPAYGSMADYLAFVRAAHARGLKVYLDEEVQYVAQGHPWLTRHAAIPAFRSVPMSCGTARAAGIPSPSSTSSPGCPTAAATSRSRCSIFAIPRSSTISASCSCSGPTRMATEALRDGVDGFRIDHMMDDLDNKHRLTNLFADFWAPIFAAVRHRNPGIRILAEQSDWGFGEDWLRRGGADAVFAFPLRGALGKLDKADLVKTIRETEARTPPGKDQIVFIENHDTDRYMSTVSDPRRARIAAAFNILLKGEPLIYYGQELGMRGRVTQGSLSDWRRSRFAKRSAGAPISTRKARPSGTAARTRGGPPASTGLATESRSRRKRRTPPRFLPGTRPCLRSVPNVPKSGRDVSGSCARRAPAWSAFSGRRARSERC